MQIYPVEPLFTHHAGKQKIEQLGTFRADYDVIKLALLNTPRRNEKYYKLLGKKIS